MSTSSNSPGTKLLSQADVLEEEFAKVHPDQLPLQYEERKPEDSAEAFEEKRLKAIFKAIHRLPKKRSALCLSGGGIRSATFGLGVLQGLARSGQLGKFDYMSTVSGGGYIGSWLTAWIQRDGADKVIKALKDNPTSKVSPEPREITHLRTYSNYLSPKIGALSVDTWTLVSIYLRNLFLNWLVFIPLLLALLMIPRFYVWAISQNPFAQPPDGLAQSPNPINEMGKRIGTTLIIVGLLIGSFALSYISSHRPSLRKRFKRRGDSVFSDPSNNLTNFMLQCMAPLMLSVILLTIGRAWYLNSGENFGSWPAYVVFGAGLHLVAWAFYFHHLRDWSDRLRELLIVFLTGVVGGAVLWLTLIPSKMLGVYNLLPSARPGIFAVIDGPLLMSVFMLMAILSIGIGSRSIDDEDREWWARAGAWVLLAIIVWALLNWLVIYGPSVLAFAFGGPGQETVVDWNRWLTWLVNLVVYVGLISGFITILFGLSSKTPATVKAVEKSGRVSIVMDYALKLAAPLFALFLVMVLSLATDVIILLIRYVPRIALQYFNEWQFYPDPGHLSTVKNSSIKEIAGLFFALLVIGYLMARRININEFSLHSLYRNRLTRAYLGASNERDPQLFTNFDPNDDLKLSQLWPNIAKGKSPSTTKPPFHILNMTWNLVGGKNLAWQYRKAVSFTASALHCGNARYGYRSSKHYGSNPTPLTLGTALTISGAAASPNMGYYSSPAITFLMTLFNVRLGWWLGNPRRDDYYFRSSPRLAVAPMFEEAFGWTNDEKRYVYLSDGGHFENLGLYEMVRRRCHFIFVVDASRDPDYKFENLGNAIRTVRVDLGVPIEIGNIFMYPRQTSKPNAYCALGKIRYRRVNEALDGHLIYIKPVIAEGEPTDVFNYAQNRDFPHEATSDQFFSEQQFESYRMLGLHATEQIFSESWLKDNDGFSGLKAQIKEFLKSFQ